MKNPNHDVAKRLQVPVWNQENKKYEYVRECGPIREKVKMYKPKYLEKLRDINSRKTSLTEDEKSMNEHKIEVEKMMNQYNVEGYPTIKLVKDGQVIEYDAKPSSETLRQFLNTVV